MKISYFLYWLMLFCTPNSFAALTIDSQDKVGNQQNDLSASTDAVTRQATSAQRAFQAVIENNRSELVDALSENRSTIDALFEGKTLLHWALLQRPTTDLYLVIDLLQHGIDISIGDPDGDTVLHYCITYEQKDALQLIFKYRINRPTYINGGNNEGLTALYYCIDKAKPTSLCTILLEHGATTEAANSDGTTVLHRAAQDGLEEHTRLLITWGAYKTPKDRNNQTPLHKAVIYNRLSVARLLPRTPDDICAEDTQGKSALFYAIEKNLKDISSLLLEPQELLSQDGQTLSCINTLYDQITLLHRACEHNSRFTANLLLKGGADVNAFTKTSNNTPLLTVVNRTDDNDLLLIELLLKNGADIHMSNKAGESVLHLSVKRNLGKVTKLLLEKNASINAQTLTGETPLYLCIATPTTDKALCRLLLDYKADPNIPTSKGERPLHKAAQEGMLEMISLLLSKGADSSVQNNFGETPFDYAINSGQQEAKNLLALPAQSEPSSLGSFLLTLPLINNAPTLSSLMSDGSYAYFSYDMLHTVLITLSILVFVKSLIERRDVIKSLIERLDFDRYHRLGDYSDSHWSALHLACHDNKFNVVKSLLSRGVDCNAQLAVSGKTALMIACEKGYEEICDLLIKNPRLNLALRDPIVGTALEWACEFERVSICRKLLQGPCRYLTNQEKASLQSRAALTYNLELQRLFSQLQ